MADKLIKLMGANVTESFTGVGGIVRGIVTHASGCQHLLIQKPGLSILDEPHKIAILDLSSIKDLKKYAIYKPTNAELLGKEVICKITNYKGIVVEIEDYKTSDSMVIIQSQTEKFEGRPAKPYACAMKNVERIDKKVIEKANKPACSVLASMRR
jgi:hypothetical protein